MDTHLLHVYQHVYDVDKATCILCKIQSLYLYPLNILHLFVLFLLFIAYTFNINCTPAKPGYSSSIL